jgi:hypothetical protein
MKSNLNDAAIYRLQRDKNVKKSAYSLASKARRIAVGLAPKGISGDYSRGIVVKVGRGANPSVYLAGTDYKSHWIEWGSTPRGHFRPGQHVLERAILAAGGGGLKYRRVGKGSR